MTDRKKMDNALREQALRALKIVQEFSDDPIFKDAEIAAQVLEVDQKCGNCEFAKFNGKDFVCTKVDKVPPKEIQKKGCELWQSDGNPIPL